ncbi:chemotaxis protein CheB [Paractinoplanes brasiliensis]|uniref:protein-glutamate methylesterase n=1 Tax=Paractinoplanes brasiliensis TaxID=52695 RepID=A0A4R6J8Y2_9ACTN|nr:chemotaxis protein CheB [Actinoplanes brasiliensis]TDO32070.1 two-component system chemotaxis response regulator CheB [Actinoplanes brasiliensis]GID28117.1 chemotaxis protein CheB [Actinoplanes brasiliensis]
MTVRDAYPVPLPVVALVASAGGIEALTHVLAPLPPGLPAAVIVALHQDPIRVSYLREILARTTSLPIAVAHDKAPMTPGRVLVVPPGYHLLVTSEARVGLIATGPIPPARPSADLLLCTLAVTCGARALAVILSGMGHDGQAGVRAVAQCGGIVLAQDAATAHFPSMPAAAVTTGAVHQVLPLDDIAEAIVKHVTAGR